MVGAGDLIHARHLLAAVCLQPMQGGVYRALGIAKSGVLRECMLNALRASYPGEAPELWRRILINRESLKVLEREHPADHRRELAGGVASDLVDPTRGIPLSEDHLGVGVYAEMLAAVIAARETPTPLSVGLFGAWGSGKSSFMGLLRHQISECAATGDPYLRNIVQIGFNAWTYADTNLWASLGNEIFRQLSGVEARQTAAREKEQDALIQQRDAARQQAETLRQKQEEAAANAARLAGELKELHADHGVSVKQVLEAANAQLEPEWTRLGIDDERERAQILTQQLRGARNDALALWAAFSGRGRWWLGALAFLSALVVLVSLVTPDQARSWLVVCGGSGLLTAISAAVGYLSVMRGAMARVAGFVRSLDQARDEEMSERITVALKALHQAKREVERLQSRHDELLSKAGFLQQELDERRPGRQLYRFVAERADSADYRGNLGLTSVIRRDLEKLAVLMNGWDPAEYDGVEKPIDRIVLYIDDLDRCAPEQVVSVLEAVHLLLALDLFVVVVGVDPRWLLHSLRQQYRSILAVAEETKEAWRSTPVDYLEKIFNIPFVLPELSTDGFATMVRQLSTQPGAFLDENPPGQVLNAAVPQEGTTAGEAAVLAVPHEVALPEVQGGSEVDQVRHSEFVALEPLNDHELAMLSGLAPLVRSPRGVKRLLNVYRMLRSTQNLSQASTFLGDEDRPGEYQPLRPARHADCRTASAEQTIDCAS